MIAQAELEHATGALNMFFMHHMITNAYQNLSNVVLVIQPAATAAAARPALLLNAHFDNTLGSPGAVPRCSGFRPSVQPHSCLGLTEWGPKCEICKDYGSGRF